jgi:C4-dicarboxylate transporter, DctM subunit
MTGGSSSGGAAPGIIPRALALFRASENLLLAVLLALMVLLPLAEGLLRAILHIGIPGSTAIVQHLTLVVGMVGGALAAREGRLLSLATDAFFTEGFWKRFAKWVDSTAGATISMVLCGAAITFVRSEAGAAKVLAFGVPVWAIQLALPIGFGLVAGRLLWGASKGWGGRIAAAAACAALVALALWPPVPPETLRWPLLGLLLAATALGTPIFATLGGAALILFWAQEIPAAAVTVEHYRLVTNPTLPAIPLFTLAGYFLAEGGASRRLVRVFDALFGSFRGGPAIVTVLVCAFFTTFTGASGVTILALGGLLMPVLISARYSDRDALGLLTGAGSLGLLFPPCLPIILYAIVAKVEVKQLFLGGFMPGVIMVLLAAAWGIYVTPRLQEKKPFRAGEAWAACWDAKWELLLPFVALAGILGGYLSPVEASALTALYAFVAEVFLYRDLKWKEIVRVTSECGLLVGGVLLILGVALGFTNYLVDAEVPARGVAWVTSQVHSPLLFLLLLNAFLLVVGCLMDIYSAIVVVVPLLVPLGAAFGIDPVHLGVIFLANLQLGYLTPPVGMNLFLASYRFDKPLLEVYRASIPMLFIFLIGVLLITYAPPLTTWLPSLAGGP